MFSDCFRAHDRIMKNTVAFIHLLQRHHNIKAIDHKFMLSGDSFLPNDAGFGVIESYNKLRPIYDPNVCYEGIVSKIINHFT